MRMVTSPDALNSSCEQQQVRQTDRVTADGEHHVKSSTNTRTADHPPAARLDGLVRA